MNPKETTQKLAFTCPVCGKRTNRSINELREGALLICPFCNLRLTLHGHMWKAVKEEIENLESS
jgi:transcription elongation factor Elf1